MFVTIWLQSEINHPENVESLFVEIEKHHHWRYL